MKLMVLPWNEWRLREHGDEKFWRLFLCLGGDNTGWSGLCWRVERHVSQIKKRNYVRYWRIGRFTVFAIWVLTTLASSSWHHPDVIVLLADDQENSIWQNHDPIHKCGTQSWPSCTQYRNVVGNYGPVVPNTEMWYAIMAQLYPIMTTDAIDDQKEPTKNIDPGHMTSKRRGNEMVFKF